MTNVNIVAPKSKVDGNYTIPIDLNGKIFSIKFDPGANQSIISVDFLTDDLSDDQKKRFIELIKARYTPKGEFISASGSPFQGYLVHAKNVLVGGELFADFYYYLILENDRILALLGEDFLDNCGYRHVPHGDIEIISFDFDAYGKDREDSISNEDFLACIDEISAQGRDPVSS